jgi:GTPase SAR1 family protein
LEGFTESEKKDYISIISNNIIDSMKILIKESEARSIENENLKIQNENLNFVNIIKQCDSFDLNPEVVKSVVALWKDKGITDTWKIRSHFQIIDSASYFFEKVEAIASPNFVPEDDDILKSRSKTTGIIEVKFDLENQNFNIVDVAGQRSERRKWLHCFEDVTAILFCVGISEYDQVIAEDGKTNRMIEAVNLFSEICNSRWFGKVDMVLFLNKEDLFKEKIAKIDMNVCFKEYTGGLNYDKGIDFLKEKFDSLNQTEKDLYIHVTVATDSDQVRIVFDAVTSIILNKILSGMGL